jgi:hypothetical protein
MRIARGLFRLWLVASALWIGGVGTITWPWGWQGAPVDLEAQSAAAQVSRFADAHPQSEIEVKTPDGIIHLFPAGTARDAIDRALRNYWRWHETKIAAEIALIPPVLLLALGSVLGWAFQGFRASP